MKRLSLALAALLMVALVAPEVADAQKRRPAAQGPDADGDGVPDSVDRCANSPRGARVNRFGCPVVLLRPGQRPDTAGPVARDTAARQPGAVAPQAQGGANQPAAQPAGRPAAQPAGAQGAVGGQPVGAQPAGAQPAGANQPGAGGGTFTAGLGMPDVRGGRDQFLRAFSRGLDTTVAAFIAVFRGTAPEPLPGATEPAALSRRERDRWLQCRNLHWDLATYLPAMEMIVDSLPENAALERAVSSLDSALQGVTATAECDNVASMLEAPQRFTGWGDQYAAAARRFHDEWYGQVREAHDRLRAFVIALNSQLPANRRLPVPPGVPRSAPYAGAGP